MERLTTLERGCDVFWIVYWHGPMTILEVGQYLKGTEHECSEMPVRRTVRTLLDKRLLKFDSSERLVTATLSITDGNALTKPPALAVLKQPDEVSDADTVAADLRAGCFRKR